MRKALRPLLEGHDAVISAAPFDGTDPRTLIAAAPASCQLPACRHQLRQGVPARSRRGWGACGFGWASHTRWSGNIPTRGGWRERSATPGKRLS